MDVKIVPNIEKPGFYTVTPQGSIEPASHGDFRGQLEGPIGAVRGTERAIGAQILRGTTKHTRFLLSYRS